jgi:hypothetical protein
MIKSTGWMLFKVILAFSLITCLWLASITYRTGSFVYHDSIESDYLMIAIAIALLVSTLKFYKNGAISTIVIYLSAISIITTIDYLWAIYGYVDAYKHIGAYMMYATATSLIIAPLSFLLKARHEPNGLALSGCWVALIVVTFAIGTHMFNLGYGMIGSSYLELVFASLIAAEVVRQYRRWQLEYGI